jgi:hypothetical protein
VNRRQRAARQAEAADARAAELDRILADDPAPASPPDVAAVVQAELDRRARAAAEAEVTGG